MKKYLVTIWVVVNPIRDAELDQPETKAIEMTVFASSEEDAVTKASNKTELSVYESQVSPI